MNEIKDTNYMEMAYGLAEKATGRTSPNPLVGAVIVKNNIIAGRGFHEGPGKPHAEIVALRQAGSQCSLGTMYLTLEPCIHWGRTPPCIESLLKSKLRRVVISSPDANPLVHNKGIGILKKSGIEVTVGLLKDKNNLLNEAYNKYITKKIPFVTLKAALSLDGKMATRNFSSQWISSPKTREYTQLLRGEYDAVMIGTRTLLLDNPRLTLRHPRWKGKSQKRIILDPQLRFPLDARIIDTLPKGEIIVFTTKPQGSPKSETLKKKGLRVVSLSGSGGRLNLRRVLTWLGEHEISSLLVEGGSRLHTAFIESNLADKAFISLSPKLIGGERAPGLYGGSGVKNIEDALRLQRIHRFEIGEDIILEGYF